MGSRDGPDRHGSQISVPDMCVFCFDVLYSELYNLDPPRDPKFTNDALYVENTTPQSIKPG